LNDCEKIKMYHRCIKLAKRLKIIITFKSNDNFQLQYNINHDVGECDNIMDMYLFLYGFDCGCKKVSDEKYEYECSYHHGYKWGLFSIKN